MTLMSGSRYLLSRASCAALALVAVFVLAGVAQACPTCKENLAQDPAAAGLVQGYFWSILFMLSMPYLIFTALASYFYYEVRKARARQAAEDASGIVTGGILPENGHFAEA